MNLILIGLRGSGKTTVGRMVSERLKRGYADLDELVAGRLGCKRSADAWNKHGEAAFRAMEVVVLREALDQDDRVLALGGGTPTVAEAEAMLRDEIAAGRATIVYLSGSAESLRERLARTDLSDRPSLTGADPLAEIEAVLARRDGLYRELADAGVETDGKTAEQVAELVAAIAPPDT